MNESQFKVKSGKVAITDPAYKKGTWCAIWDIKVKKGIWEGKVIGDGVLLVHHVDNKISEYNTSWEKFDTEIGVDSGQISVYDMSLASDNPGDYGDLNTFYGRACDASDNDNVVDGKGFVCGTAYGDGSYNAYYIKNGNDIVAIKIVTDDSDREEEDECPHCERGSCD